MSGVGQIRGVQYEIVPCRCSPYGSTIMVVCPHCGEWGKLWKSRRENWWWEARYYIHHGHKRCTVLHSNTPSYAEIDRIYHTIIRCAASGGCYTALG